MSRMLCSLLFLLGDTFADVLNALIHFAVWLESPALVRVALLLARVARLPGWLAWRIFPGTCERI